MFATMIHKELRGIISSPKFVGTFLVCTVLILLSVFTGIREYQALSDQYSAASQLVDSELRETTSWGRMSTSVYRAPEPTRIFSAGLDYDIGRLSDVRERVSPKLDNSAYSDDPIFAVFRFVDFAFITQFILTLFAILFTFNAISGEREDGTLKLIFSNPVPRARYILTKCLGAWLGLVVPISIPVLLGVLMVVVSGVSMDATQWLRVALMLGLALLLFTFFVVLGVFVSALTRRSSVSFLVSLVLWIGLVMIIPRVGVMAAGTMVSVPRMAEIEQQIEGYSSEQWDKHYNNLDNSWTTFENEGEEGTCNDEALWKVMQSQDSSRKAVEADIEKYDALLHEDLRQRKNRQEVLALTLSRFSPASAFQLGAMRLAGTDLEVKNRTVDAIGQYREDFYEYVEERKEETGDHGGLMIAVTVDENGAEQMSFGGSRDQGPLDVSGVPRFSPPELTLAEAVGPAITDFGLLSVYILIVFAGAFIAFLRYDVR